MNNEKSRYAQTLDFLFSQLPMYQRIGKAAYKENLDNTLALCEILGNPQDGLKTIHIAGTNGKGSVSHILASVLQEAGYKTGLYTSPHLKDFRERIKIDGKEITEEYVCNFVDKYKKAFETIQPSFFEMTVGMAFKFFHDNQTDIAIIETGLGGRLDSTNIISPFISVITNIGFDHTQFLGNTYEKIATEKAGIIKEEIPVVIGETHPETKNIFIEQAIQNNSTIHFADQVYKCEQSPDTLSRFTISLKEKNASDEIFCFYCPLNVAYQTKNFITAYTTLKTLLKNKYFSKIHNTHIKNGLNNVIINTGFKGRWQTLNTSPLIICDLAHNIDGIRALINNIYQLKYNTLHLVIGFVDDKSVDEILSILPKEAIYYFCKANISRALNTKALYELATKHKLNGSEYPSVLNALNTAKEKSRQDDFIMVTGSTFVVSEIV